MSLQVQAARTSVVPVARAGASPHSPPRAGASRGSADAVARPLARPSLPVPPPPKHPVDGTPEVLAAGMALGVLALGADVAATGVGVVLRSSASYAARLVHSMLRCVADPVRTGEHIAEGVVGGAAWAGAAAGVAALADAARTHASHAPPQR